MADTEKGSTPPRRAGAAARKFRPGGFAKSTLRVTESGLDGLLNELPAAAPAKPDAYDFGPIGRRVHHHGNHDFNEMDNEPGLDTDGDHVGRDLSNKQGPAHPIEQAGPNPYGDRKFHADEFQGMLTFDPQGKPAFHSRFPEAKSVEDITELRINIATRMPDYMTGDTPQAKEIEAMEADAFDGMPLKDVFSRVDDTMIEQVERYAKEFEEAFGIKMTVGHDLPDAHLSLLGYTKGDPNLLGFASFPPSVNEWEELEGLGAQPGYMVMNNQYTAGASEKEIYDLFTHEFGHTLGFAHPHDLALLNMSKREALTATKMAYTDLKLRAFQHVVTDGDGNPQLDEDGKKQYYSSGPDVGALDMSFRKWVANPPVMGQVKEPNPESPDYDGYKGVYDLNAHAELAVAENSDSIVYSRERLLPMVPILNDGKNTVLKGTPGNDYLDTNPGYASVVQAPQSRAKQEFLLVEGHMEKVLGIRGNNIIVAAQHGNQEIHPGTGENKLHFLYPDMQGEKTVVSEGKDTLVLTEALMEKQTFKAGKEEDGISLTSGDARINLKGEGVERIKIINNIGRIVNEFDTAKMSVDDLNTQIFQNDAWKGRQKAEAPSPATPDAAKKSVNGRVPLEALASRNAATEKPATQDMWQRRIESARANARGTGHGI